jgi:hypothetical protein
MWWWTGDLTARPDLDVSAQPGGTAQVARVTWSILARRGPNDSIGCGGGIRGSIRY